MNNGWHYCKSKLYDATYWLGTPLSYKERLEHVLDCTFALRESDFDGQPSLAEKFQYLKNAMVEAIESLSIEKYGWISVELRELFDQFCRGVEILQNETLS